MQLRYRSNQRPTRRSSDHRTARRSARSQARRLRLESLESRALLAVTALIDSTTVARAFVPTAADYDDLGLDWTGSAEPFDDSAWRATPVGGPNGVGYPITGAYSAYVGADILADMRTKSLTSYVRIPFTAADIAEFDTLTLKMRYDDGFIAYLNGVEIQRVNVDPASPSPSWDTPASGSAPVVGGYVSYDVSSHLSALKEGTNVLAIRGFVTSLASILPHLVQGALDAESPDTPPVAVDDTFSFRTDQVPPSLNVLANDTAGSYAINPATVQVVDQPAGGTATVNANGSITYTPNAGFAGTDTLTYRVRDTNPAPTPGGGATQSTVVSTTAAHRRFVPTAAVAPEWTGSGTFNDALWTVGSGGVGYDTDAAVDYEPFFANGTVVMQNVNPSVYVRYPFTVANPSSVVSLRLRMRWEDGFVAWINGVQVAAMNAPATPAFNSTSTGGARNEAMAIVQDEFIVNLTLPGLALRSGVGANILAIQGLNDAVGSSDLLIEPELIAETSTTGEWSNEATVTLNVTGPGPVAAPDSAFTQDTTQPVSAVTIDVLANDTPGFSGAAIRRDTVQVTQQPANGTIEAIDLATGAITYRPDAGFYGDDVFKYTVRDNAPVGGTQNTTFLSRGSVWKYLDNGTDQGTAWTGVTFDDSTWASGPAELGYADAPVTTVSYGPNANSKYITTYFRTTFDLVDPSAVQVLNVLASYDDGALVYINGVEVARSPNMPAGTITYQTVATPDHEGGTFEQLASLMPAQLTMLRTGTNVVAVEIHQNAPTSSDLTMDLELTGTLATATGYLSNEAEVHVHVNAHPNAVADTIQVGPQGTTGSVPNTITFNPLANDSDPDSSPSTPPGSFGIDPSTLVITQQPTRTDDPQRPAGEIVGIDPVTGAITYRATGITTPQTVTFRYTVRDYEGAVSQEATVTANIVVTAPQPVDDTAVTPEGQPVVINVLANDVRGDLLINTGSVTIDVNALPSNGTVTVNATAGTIRYTPNPGFRDQFDSFGYTISDLSGNRSATATVTVDVFSLAIAREDGFALAQGATSVTIPIADIFANDYYPPTFQPELVIVNNSATKGTAVINSSGGVQQSITFTPSAGATGVAGFTYYLRDKDPNPTRPNSNNARVNIALGAVNVSGIVYVDVNRNNVHDPGEQLVPDATIVLTRAGDPAFRRTTITNSLGQYSFASTAEGVLPPDTYTITEIQPSLYLDFTTGAVNSYTVALTAQDNPGYDFREWTVNPQFFTMLASYGGGFLASQQPVSLSANSLVVPYDLGWNGAFTAKATYDPALGPVSVKLYNGTGAVVANSATNPSSTPGESVINYQASLSQPLVLVVSGSNPNVSIQSPSLGTTAGDTTPPFVSSTSLSSTRWTPQFVANLAAHSMGTAGYSVAAGETLPWRNLDRVTMRFTEPVVVSQGDLRLWGVAVADYRTDVGIQSFAYDPFTFTATWTLTEPIAADQLRVGLSDAVRDTWGNRVGGAGFERLFNVLPGGSATLGDVLSHQFTSIGSPRYAPHLDLDGNGVVNFVDAIHLRNAAGTSLPAGTPGNGSTSTPPSTPSPQAPSAVIVAASRDAGLDVAAASRRTSSTAVRTATAGRLIARNTQAAATDAALDSSATAASGSTAAGNSLTALRARRAARSADDALSSLGDAL